MHLFTYRGLRVHKFYRHIRVITSLLMLSPFLIGNVFYYYPIYDLIIADPLFYLPKILLTTLPPIVIIPVSYTHLTLPTTLTECRSRWSPYH